MQSWFPTDADAWANQMEVSLSVGDWITNVAYFSVVSICAPIWEEVSCVALSQPKLHVCDTTET